MTTTIKEVTVPDIGNFSNVEIIEVAVKVGDQVKAEDSLIALETEKASMDVPSPYSGTIKEMKVKLGDRVSQGSLILLIEADEAGASQEKPKAATASAAAPPPSNAISASPPKRVTASEPPQRSAGEFVHAGPATRQLARELGVNLLQVGGTGRKDRVTTEDVKTFVKAVLQSGGSTGVSAEKAPEIDFAQFGQIEIKPLSRVKKWTGKNLHRNWITIPHITQFEDADITDLEIERQNQKQAAEAQGIKLTPLAFIIKACVSALKAYPQFNASLAANGTDIVFKQYYHIGFAVDTPNGLMVPIIREADKKSLFEIAKALVELSNAAREGKLKADQMQGSCFTISSLGSIGGTAFTPIVNAPDVAILGISKVQMKPVYIKEQFVPRKILPLSLSYDHRVIDGVEGAKFAAHIAQVLQDPKKLAE